MFSSKDFEKCWFLYQSEGLPYNLSPTSETKQGASEDQAPSKESVRIAVTICMSNGVFVKRKNLSYESLLKFVEKLEGLC